MRTLMPPDDLGELEQIAAERAALESLAVERRLQLLQQQGELKDASILRSGRCRLRNCQIPTEDKAAGKYGAGPGGHAQEAAPRPARLAVNRAIHHEPRLRDRSAKLTPPRRSPAPADAPRSSSAMRALSATSVGPSRAARR